MVLLVMMVNEVVMVMFMLVVIEVVGTIMGVF